MRHSYTIIMTVHLKSTGLINEFMNSDKYIFIYVLLEVRISSKQNVDVGVAITKNGYCAFADNSIFRAIK